MASIISAGTTSGTSLNLSGDTSGVLQLASNGSTTAVTIDTNQRAAFVAGTAALPAITTTGDTNTGMWFPAADTIAFTEGGVESMRIDSSGNVGIGVTNPGNKVALPNNQYLAFQNSTGGETAYIGMTSANLLNFSDKMAIDSSGRMLINATASVDNNARIQVFSTAGNGNANFIASLAGGSGASNANQTVGYMVGQTNCQVYGAWDGSGNSRNSVYVSAVSNGVQLSSGSSSWSAISDERKKDIIEPITNATNKVSSIRAVIGKYKTDEEGTRRSFLIAQDVQAVLPEAVTVEDEGQDTEKLLLSYTDVIPLLVAAIKELKTELDSVKTELDATKAEVQALKGTAL